jgi:hypothetical protein
VVVPGRLVRLSLAPWRLGGKNRWGAAIVVVTSLLCCAALASGEEDPALPGLAPVPRLVPLTPVVGLPERDDADEKLLRRIAEQAREREQRIAELLDAHGGARPPLADTSAPELVRPRKDRDQAWAALQAALQKAPERARAQGDPLDAGTAVNQARQEPLISAANQLRIAECYRDLAAAPMPDGKELDTGLDVLAKLDPGLLAESERPRYHYLRTWFLAEQARHASGPERARLLLEAQAAARELQARPDSELAAAAQALFIGLSPPPAEENAQ